MILGEGPEREAIRAEAVRLGVGHPGAKSEVVGWVLKKPPTDQRIAIEQAIEIDKRAPTA